SLTPPQRWTAGSISTRTAY
ncbi:hypothetical protein AZZ67_005310, partial [Klebsiella pneumoniae]